MTATKLSPALLALILAGCSESPSRTSTSPSGGTIVIATTSDPDALFPPLSLNMEARQATELMYEYLADVGPGMNTIGDSAFVRQLAKSWTWARDSMSIAFHIDPAARWHDSTRVSAYDVAFTWSIYNDEAVGSPVASSLGDIVSVTARDSGTAVFEFMRRTPRTFYDAASQMLILPQHVFGNVPRDSLRAFAAAHTPVGSGRYRFHRWDRGSSFELRAVENHYRGAPNPTRIVWTITPEYESAVTRLIGGDADVFPTIRQESIPQVTSGGTFRLESLPGMDYIFMQFNLRDPAARNRPHRIFGSSEMRRAITMAIDRTSMVKNIFDTLAIVSIGPTLHAHPTTDTSVRQIPFAPGQANRLLDSLGWIRRSSAGVRMKDGLPLRFDVIVPVSSLSRTRMAVLIQEQLRRVGIDLRIDNMDYSAFSSRQAGRSFDAALAAWHLGSSPGAVKQTWTSGAGLNYGGYDNPGFDALVDSALAATSMAESRTYFTRANQLIVDDAPAVWLYEPLTVLAIHRRIRTTAMRPNAWWLDIGSWSIPAGERIDRDRL